MNGNEFLPSRSEGAAKTAILEFAESVTEPGGSYVPPAERIATFDNDGTLWCQKPLYVHADFVFRRWKAMVETDPAKANDQLTGARGEPPSQARERARPRSGAARGRSPKRARNHGPRRSSRPWHC
jgi:hypothetical protein